MAPLIVIVGETATGKSDMAIDLARRFNGEIICADSRTVYRGMNIGTAKPNILDQHLVRHHLVDVVNPDEPFTVADFKQLAEAAIVDISARGKVPFLVGGSGLYIDAILYNYGFSAPVDPDMRLAYEQLDVDSLQSRLRERGIALPENARNKRYLVRALETGGVRAGDKKLRSDTLVLGMHTLRETLVQRITDRVDSMLAMGLEAEVRRLAETYGWDNEPMKGVGYREFTNYFNGQQTIAQTRLNIIQSTCKLAKKQRTWFKRNSGIHWPEDANSFVDAITTFLNNYR